MIVNLLGEANNMHQQFPWKEVHLHQKAYHTTPQPMLPVSPQGGDDARLEGSWVGGGRNTLLPNKEAFCE